eukprot:GEMP01113466.1.p1 GENE.GEMP01113466.1~~GEMP01113466.1.p1  ORF type:complete len:165 (+),score=33.80 GEMP01113466.1:165-659(+)
MMDMSRQAFFQSAKIWNFERHIAHINGTSQRALGSATFSPSEVTPDVLCYEEKGHISIGATQHPFHARYVYSFTPELISIYLPAPSNLLLVAFCARSLAVVSDPHLCVKDTYTGHLEISDSNAQWRLRYTTQGPTKNFTIDTRYFAAHGGMAAHDPRSDEELHD